MRPLRFSPSSKHVSRFPLLHFPVSPSAYTRKGAEKAMERFSIPSADGRSTLAAYAVIPPSPRAMLQISHGMCEYFLRYEGFAEYLAEQGKLDNNTVVTTVMSNFGLYKAFDEAGIGYAKTAVGDKYVYEYMANNNCRIGGEQSGHIIFMKYATTGDGILTALQIINVMLDERQPLSALTAPVVFYPQVLKNIRVTDKAAVRANAAVTAAVEAVAARLGDSGRILVRESGTEPLIRVMVECADEALCGELADSVIAVIRQEGLA